MISSALLEYKFNKYIYQGYGATETCGGVSMCPADIENPPKSVGRIVASKKIKIVDPVTLKSVKTGEPGELLVFSDYMVTAYLNKHSCPFWAPRRMKINSIFGPNQRKLLSPL